MSKLPADIYARRALMKHQKERRCTEGKTKMICLGGKLILILTLIWVGGNFTPQLVSP